MTPEGKVKAEIKKELARLQIVNASEIPKYIDQHKVFQGWYYMPVQSVYSVKGVPDFIGCFRGAFFAIEAKAPGGVTSPNQDYQIDGISMSGGMALVTSDASEVAPFLRATIIGEEVMA